MNRSARSLLGVSVLAPVVAAFAVTAVPANAASGPSAMLPYERAATSAPAPRTLPEPVGQAAELSTTAVDEVPRIASATPGLRSAAGRSCKLNPGKTVNSHAGTSLPATPLPSVGKTPLGKSSKQDCLATGRRAGTNPLPVEPNAATRVPDTLLKDAGQVGGAVHNSELGGLPGTEALPRARSAAPGPDVSSTLGDVRSGLLPSRGSGPGLPDVGVARLGEPSAVPAVLGSERVGGPRDGVRSARDVGQVAGGSDVPFVASAGRDSGLGDVPSTLSGARAAGVPVGRTIFPPAGRYAGPPPSDSVIDQANHTVNKAGTGIDRTEDGVGSVVEVLKSRDRLARTTDTSENGLPGAAELG